MIMRKMRGVIVVDVEIYNHKAAMEFEKVLRDAAARIKAETASPITQTQAELIKSVRSGPTGSIKNLVFRGDTPQFGKI
jgi:hypothetical protein